MGILGIHNRTENWKTARKFAPFFNKNNKTALANLVKHLNPGDKSNPEDLKIELFWKGIRDLRHGKSDELKKEIEDRLVNQYKERFKSLRTDVANFDELKLPEEWNYDATKAGARSKLINNLRNSEIDIVIESRSHLYIGEAKDEAGFGADGQLVLVHQLIRQHVVATLFLDAKNEKRKIEQFVVLRKLPNANRLPRQIEFAIDQCWLKKDNILTWDRLSEIGTVVQ